MWIPNLLSPVHVSHDTQHTTHSLNHICCDHHHNTHPSIDRHSQTFTLHTTHAKSRRRSPAILSRILHFLTSKQGCVVHNKTVSSKIHSPVRWRAAHAQNYIVDIDSSSVRIRGTVNRTFSSFFARIVLIHELAQMLSFCPQKTHTTHTTHDTTHRRHSHTRHENAAHMLSFSKISSYI